MDYIPATRTILAAFIAAIAGTDDIDGITAAITADITAATGHTPTELGAHLAVTSNRSVTVTLPGRSPVTVPPADAVVGILEWHRETVYA